MEDHGFNSEVRVSEWAMRLLQNNKLDLEQRAKALRLVSRELVNGSLRGTISDVLRSIGGFTNAQFNFQLFT